MEAAGFDAAIFAATRALDAGHDVAAAHQVERFDAADGEKMDVVRQHPAARPIVGMVARAPGPIDRNAAIAEACELFEKQHDRRRAGAVAAFT